MPFAMNTGKFFKNSYFEEYLRAAASAPDRNILKKSKPVIMKISTQILMDYKKFEVLNSLLETPTIPG